MGKTWNGVEDAFKRAELEREERNRKVTITFHFTGETFCLKKKVAIPLLEAIRIYTNMDESHNNTNSDIIMTARMLQLLAEIQ